MTATMKYHPQLRPEDSFMDRGIHMEAEDREETSVETAFLGRLLGKSFDLVWGSILPEGVQWLSGLFGGLN